MAKKIFALLVLLVTFSPTYASSIFQVMSKKIMVVPVRGKIFVKQNGEKSMIPVSKAINLSQGDSLFVGESGEALLDFPDGFQQMVSGEAEYTVTPIFPTSSFNWGSIHSFLSSLF